MAKKAVKSKKVSLDKKELLSSPQSYRSLFFGVATVIILFLIGFGITRLFLSGPTPEISDEAVSTESVGQALNNVKSGDYAVKTGDTLWSIAEEKYGSGFEWYRIADANNIQDSTNLEEGTMLVIPEMNAPEAELKEVAEMTPTPSITQATPEKPAMESQVGAKINGDSYVIQPGDDLWDIAVRAYGDGYKWVDIASANKLEDPNLIHSDNKLVLPR